MTFHGKTRLGHPKNKQKASQTIDDKVGDAVGKRGDLGVLSIVSDKQIDHDRMCMHVNLPSFAKQKQGACQQKLLN
jgi:hypothetical protein